MRLLAELGAKSQARVRQLIAEGITIFHVIATGEDYHADLGLWAREAKANEVGLAEAVRECGGYRTAYPNAHVVRVGAQGETTFGIELDPQTHELAPVTVRVQRRLVNP